MSTKSHILYENEIEIYEETIEAVSRFGKHIGYNIHFILLKDYITSFKIDNDFIKIVSRTEHLPSVINFWLGGIKLIEYDEDGLYLIIKGDCHYAKDIVKKDFNKFTISN